MRFGFLSFLMYLFMLVCYTHVFPYICFEAGKECQLVYSSIELIINDLMQTLITMVALEITANISGYYYRESQV